MLTDTSEWKVMLLSSAKKIPFSLLSVLHIFDSLLIVLGSQQALKSSTCGAYDFGREREKRKNRDVAVEVDEDGLRLRKSFSLRHISVPASCLGVPGGQSQHARSQVAHTCIQ